MYKKLSASGGFGLCPWTVPALAPRPRFRLVLRALAMFPPLANPGSATTVIQAASLAELGLSPFTYKYTLQ